MSFLSLRFKAELYAIATAKTTNSVRNKFAQVKIRNPRAKPSTRKEREREGGERKTFMRRTHIGAVQ